MSFRFVLAGGGTAGHINPAIAIGEYILSRQPEAEALYIGRKGGMEEELVPASGFRFEGIEVQGFSRSVSWQGLKNNAATVKKAMTAQRDAMKLLRDFQPDICIGTGGYVSGPVLRAAARLKIPYIIHEQNAFPGVTNKLLAKHAACVMLAMPAAKDHFKGHIRFAETGNPVREEILTARRDECRKKMGLDERPVILSFGGSLGAKVVNEAVADIIARSAQDGRYQHIHAYGRYGKWFPDLLREKGADLEKAPHLDIREYISDMPQCLAAADVVIARAGAITLSEIEVQGKPSILIPSPNVAENHQYHNAMSLASQGAAVVIEEKDLTPARLTEEIDRLASDPQKLKAYSENARRMAINDAAARIYSIVIEVLSKKTRTEEVL